MASFRHRLGVAGMALLFSLAAQAHPPPPGSPAPYPPVQTQTAIRPFTHKNYRLTPLAAISLEARVLGRERYWLDAGADLAPVDLALGWQQMAESAVLEKLTITQGRRFYHYRWPDAPPLDPALIIRQSANMHMIPSTAEIAAALARVPLHAVIKIEGYLVRADRADGFSWASSLTRDDTGYGACELVYVLGLARLY